VPHTDTSSKAQYSPYQVQVLDRALAILEALSGENPDLSLAQISEQLGLHKSTAHRLVRVLERQRLVEKDAATGHYRLGLRLFEFGAKAVARLNVVSRARPLLERLVRETGETVHLCALDGAEVLYIDKVEPSRSVRMASSVGRRNPAHSTAVGKALLARLPEAELSQTIGSRRLEKLTPHTITSASGLRAELAVIHQRGYAIDNEENEEGVRCVGAPVFNYTGAAIAAISVSAPTFRLNPKQVPQIAQYVMAAARDLSAELGFRITQATEQAPLPRVARAGS
jgi:IclR family transcriptional regulator, KDG regulon repressor